LLLLSSIAFGAELSVVVRVTDGHTIVVKVGADQHKIRLSGVDAPELAPEFGKQSRANLAGLVEGKWVAVVWSKKDGYSRLLGMVLLGSTNEAWIRVVLQTLRGGRSRDRAVAV